MRKSPANKLLGLRYLRTPQRKVWGVFVFCLSLFFILFGLDEARRPAPPSQSESSAEAPRFCVTDDATALPGASTVEIDRVNDGDTLTLTDGRRVRLIGINTPELRRKGESPEPFAREAKVAVDHFVSGDVNVVLVVGQDPRDNYGRVLGHIYNSRGHSLEADLLRQGLGWHIAVPPNLTLVDCLAEAEAWARKSRLGVWQLEALDAGAVRSGGFRRIRGRVEKVTFSKSWWLELDGRVAAVIYRENQHQFDRRWLESLVGKEVEIRGWLYPSQRAEYKPWRVKLETPFAIAVSD